MAKPHTKENWEQPLGQTQKGPLIRSSKCRLSRSRPDDVMASPLSVIISHSLTATDDDDAEKLKLDSGTLIWHRLWLTRGTRVYTSPKDYCKTTRNPPPPLDLSVREL